jgi:hypothetical protein
MRSRGKPQRSWITCGRSNADIRLAKIWLVEINPCIEAMLSLLGVVKQSVAEEPIEDRVVHAPLTHLESSLDFAVQRTKLHGR